MSLNVHTVTQIFAVCVMPAPTLNIPDAVLLLQVKVIIVPTSFYENKLTNSILRV